MRGAQGTGSAEALLMIYDRLNGHFGNCNWWPAATPLEVIFGAILTQNTNWKNVEKALENLRAHGLLDPEELLQEPDKEVARLIRPSGYYNVKTKRLKAFLRFLHDEYNSSLDAMFDRDMWGLRAELLAVQGIGEETADSILLYAGGKAIFVVDTYTQRILQRTGMITDAWSYQDTQKLFMDNLPHDVGLFNQYHALFVHTGKDYCRKKPLCEHCPLRGIGNETLCGTLPRLP
jgi:endonuclease-3 related protein